MGAGRKNVVAGLLGLAAMMLYPYVEACGCRLGFPVYYMGTIFAVTNVLVGLVLARVALGSAAKATASYLAIAGIALVPVMLLLQFVLLFAWIAVPTVAAMVLPTLCTVVAVAIVLVGVVKAPSAS